MEPEPVETDDGHMILLQDLLELLEGSDVWDMPELKDEIGRVISERKLLSRDTYQMSTFFPSFGIQCPMSDLAFQSSRKLRTIEP